MLPVRGATGQRESVQAGKGISIHAPRAGSDLRDALNVLHLCNFNPCSPCGERRWPPKRMSDLRYFNPCSPCGERPPPSPTGGYIDQFQSMLPVRGATCARLRDREARIFQSMLPVRGATSRLPNGIALSTISIHAPRAGSDSVLRRTSRFVF